MRVQYVSSCFWIFNSINESQTGHSDVIDPNLLPKFRNWKVTGLAAFLVFIFNLRMRSNECMYLWEPWDPSTSRWKMMINNLSSGYDHWRAGCDEWMQMLCFCFFPCHLSLSVSVTLCNVLATPQNSLIKGLPDNDAASPAVRRACQPAARIEVNKPKCMYMLRDRLLSEQQGSGGTDLLRFSVQP